MKRQPSKATTENNIATTPMAAIRTRRPTASRSPAAMMSIIRYHMARSLSSIPLLSLFKGRNKLLNKVFTGFEHGAFFYVGQKIRGER